jgi:hypothetical protein
VQEHPSQQGAHVEVAGERGGELLHHRVVGTGGAGQPAPEARHHVRGARRVLGGDGHDLVQPEGSGGAEERLRAAVVAAGDQSASPRRRIDHPAGEGPCRLGHVVLGVRLRAVPLVSLRSVAEGEQLEELAGEVLVRRTDLALAPVEPHEHGRVACDRSHQRVEAVDAELVERLALHVHELGHLHLLDARGEVVVPEEGELLAHGVVGHHHPAHPPERQGATLLRSRPLGRLARGIVGFPRGEVPGRVEGRRRERASRRVRSTQVAQLLDGALVAKGRQLVDAGRGGTEGHAAHELRDVATSRGR